MKRVIRSGLFETNSSSVHAIVVNPKSELIIPDTHVIGFTLGTYGWEFKTHNTIDDRASYLWTAILDNYSKIFGNLKDRYYTKEAREWVDYINNAVNNRFKGDVLTYFEWPKSDKSFFYIDHAHELSQWLDYLKSNEDNLLQFLLGSDSVIRTGNDNCYEEFPDTSCPDGWYIFKK